MKAKLIGNKLESGFTQHHFFKKSGAGFSTVEMLIAFAVLIIALASVIQVTFGNQSLSIDSQTNDEALFLAQHILEDSRASSSHSNFLNIVSIPKASVSTDIYSRETLVSDISPCSKQVTGLI